MTQTPFSLLLGYGLVVTLISSIFSVSPQETLAATPTKEIDIFHPGYPWETQSLTTLESSLGFKFAATKWYSDWPDPFDQSTASLIAGQNKIPELSWQPQVNGQGVDYQAVVNGQYDSYLNTFAASVKQYEQPLRISLAPEMNGDWTPWALGQNKNTASQHIAFYRHVVDRFRAASVTNVSWIWAPNVHYPGEIYPSFASYYPGDAYVDIIGFDGYNWGTVQSETAWQTFDQVFGSSYNDILSLSTRPILIMETGSTELGGNKAAWISDMFHQMATHPRYLGVTWFNMNKETDWRIDSSPAALAAFKQGAPEFLNSQTDPIIPSTPTPTPTIPVATPTPPQATNSPLPISGFTPPPKNHGHNFRRRQGQIAQVGIAQTLTNLSPYNCRHQFSQDN